MVGCKCNPKPGKSTLIKIAIIRSIRSIELIIIGYSLSSPDLKSNIEFVGVITAYDTPSTMIIMRPLLKACTAKSGRQYNHVLV